MKTAVPIDLEEYLIARVARLRKINEESAEFGQYAPLVAETFKQMEFEVATLPQGPRKNPYAALRFREENTAFLLDIKFNSAEYFATTDDRALKESIKDNCDLLRKEGYKKTVFVIISDSFDSTHDTFINYISWNTEIKKMLLMTTDALLHLLAYKNKDKVKLEVIVDHMANFGNIVTTEAITGLFGTSNS